LDTDLNSATRERRCVGLDRRRASLDIPSADSLLGAWSAAANAISHALFYWTRSLVIDS
jgi:hypothetical protein